MNTEFDALTLALQQQINQICDRFEAAWKAGARPRIEDYLGGLDDSVRRVLVNELVRVDIDYRLKRGENARAQKYQARFPSVDPTWLAHLLQCSADDTPCGSPPGNDRNLLFGVLALQMDFIKREALIAAMHLWMLEKQKPLGQILVELGFLAADERDVLEPLVNKHLARHDNDTDQSLRSLHAQVPLPEQLAQIPDAAVQHTLARVSGARPATGYSQANTKRDTRRPDLGGGRFDIGTKHRGGGQGEVWLARDLELDREVAIKVIKAEYADDPETRRRLKLEAELTGGLEHPGIVPVYGAGQDATGRPFYAMRLIKGESLQDAINQYHKSRGPGASVATHLAFRQLLARFVAVCDAVAYAHSRGVLHRDLKPGNIMLGKYGETLVVDWGLAKAVGRTITAQDSGEGTRRSNAAIDLAETYPGALLGTPGYMSPEQAAGEFEQMRAPSDVYSLGATLYTLLTGTESVQGNADERLEKSKNGSIIPPHQVNHAVPVGLSAICMKAMAYRSENRYATALELAADVERWLADEPVTARREPLGSRAARWMRHHRPVVASGVALLATAVIALTISTILIAQEQQHTEVARKNSETARKKTLASLELFTQVTEEQLVELPGMEAQLQEISDLLVGIQAEPTEKEIPLIHYRLGKAWKRLGGFERALGHFREAIKLFDNLDSCADGINRTYWLCACHNELGDTLRRCKSQDAQVEFETALKLQSETPVLAPQDLQEAARIHNNFGILLINSHDFAGARKSLDAARALLSGLTANNPEAMLYQADLAQVLINDGVLQENLNHDENAEHSYTEAIKKLETLRRVTPTNWENENRLGLAYSNLGQFLMVARKKNETEEQAKTRKEEAHRRLCAAQDLFARLTINFPTHHEYRHGLGLSRFNLGLLHYENKRLDLALDLYNDAESAWKSIANLAGHHEYRSCFARLHQARASVYRLEAKWAEAAKDLDVAVLYQKHARDLNTKNPDYLDDLKHQYKYLIDTLIRQEDDDGATRRTREFITLFVGTADSACDLAGYLSKRAPAAEMESKAVGRLYDKIAMILLADALKNHSKKADKAVAESAQPKSVYHRLRSHPEFSNLLKFAQPTMREKQE